MLIAKAAPAEIRYHAEQKFEVENDERIDRDGFRYRFFACFLFESARLVDQPGLVT